MVRIEPLVVLVEMRDVYPARALAVRLREREQQAIARWAVSPG